jgi:hypothetical protein
MPLAEFWRIDTLKIVSVKGTTITKTASLERPVQNVDRPSASRRDA